MDNIKKCILDDLNSREAFNLLPVLIYLGIIVIFGCAGNGLSLFLYSTKFKQSNSRCFFRFLSAMELFSCAFIVPMEIFTLTHHFELEFGNVKCRALMFTSIWQVNVSSTTLILIALDRWRKICHPFKWQISLKLSKILLISLLVAGCVVSLPSLSVYSSTPYPLHNLTIAGGCGGGAANMTVTVYKCWTRRGDGLVALYGQLYVLLFWLLVLLGVAVLAGLYWNIQRTVSRQEARFSSRHHTPAHRHNRFVLQDSVDVERRYEGKSLIESDESIGGRLQCMRDVGVHLAGECALQGDIDRAPVAEHANCATDCSTIGNQPPVYDIIEADAKHDGGRGETGVVCGHNLAAEITGCRDQVYVPGVAGGDLPVSKFRGRMLPRTRAVGWMARVAGGRIMSSASCPTPRGPRARNVTLIMFVVTVSSVLSFIPYLVLSSLRALWHDVERDMAPLQYAAYNVALRSYFLKALTNPIVYGLLDPRFRASARKLCKKKT